MLPKLDLTTLFLSVSTAAGQALNETPPNIAVAQQNIELLELLQEKTKGNLSGEEQQILAHLLFQLRMQYVKAKETQST